MGINTKKKNVMKQFLDLRQSTNIAYKNYIEQLLADVRKQYMKVAPKLAELLKDYIALESLRDGDGCGYAYFKAGHVKCLPNCDNNSKPFFKYNYYTIAGKNRSRVLKKYNIPEYFIKRVHLYDYNL